MDAQRSSRSPVRAIVAIALAVVGGATMVLSFSVAVGTALGGDPIGHLIAIFVAGAIAGLVAIVLAVVCIVRRDHRGLGILALVLALAPVVLWLILGIRANL